MKLQKAKETKTKKKKKKGTHEKKKKMVLKIDEQLAKIFLNFIHSFILLLLTYHASKQFR